MTSALNPATLAGFQDGFAQALFSGTAAVRADIAALTAQPAFAVYRNTVMKGCIDALQANYPAVARLVGEAWFRAAAAIHVRDALPQLPMLVQYGSEFPAFLERFEPAAELPYLPGVARLDRCWSEAHVAADDPLLAAGDLDALAAGNYFRVGLKPHAAARWMWFDEAPVWTIWSRNRADEPFDGDIDWRAEGALLTRPRDAVQWIALGRAGCAFMDACAAGHSVAAATQAALDVDAQADLAGLISTLLQAGAFSRLVPLD